MEYQKSFPKMLFRFVKSQHLATSKLFSLGFSSGNIFYGSSNPAAEHRRAELTAHGHRCDDIVVIARNDHADGRLPVIRAVGRVRARAPMSNQTSPRTTRRSSSSSSFAGPNVFTGFACELGG